MDTPINPNIELRKKISLENYKILRHKKALKELENQQKKIALEKLEAAINTFTDGACFLKLSEDGNNVRINFGDDSTQGFIVSGYSGIEMLYHILKCVLLREPIDKKKRRKEK